MTAHQTTDNTDDDLERFLSREEVRALVGLSDPTVWELCAAPALIGSTRAPHFPKPRRQAPFFGFFLDALPACSNLQPP